jgi:hypothetical protein
MWECIWGDCVCRIGRLVLTDEKHSEVWVIMNKTLVCNGRNKMKHRVKAMMMLYSDCAFLGRGSCFCFVSFPPSFLPDGGTGTHTHTQSSSAPS